jgi:SAM-dependent methyltransferase
MGLIERVDERIEEDIGLKSLAKDMLKRLSKLGLEVNHSLDSGISLFGLNLSAARHGYDERGGAALSYCRALGPKTVLDVGSGGGQHAAAFVSDGAAVTCIDYGTSIYAKNSSGASGAQVINTDFSTWTPDAQYDLVWASHVLEHQRNVGMFIERLINCCAPDGHVAIVVPFPHRRLWGGHVTLWTPGLLAYNVAICGVDLRDAVMRYGYRETWLVFRPKRILLPELTYDSGDVDKLSQFLPRNFRENGEPWF